MPADQPAEIGALDVVEERAAKGEISPTVARKILDDNRGGSTGYRSTSSDGRFTTICVISRLGPR